MSDVALVAMLAALPPTVAALATLIVALRNTRKTDEIHTITNGNLSKVTASLETANVKIEGLQKLVAEMRKPTT